MFRLVTGGTGWLWIFRTCRLPQKNRYALVTVNCFSRWTEACSLPNKTAVAVADTFFQLVICRFAMLAVIHLDQGRELENHLMQELCLLLGAHKTCTTLYYPVSDGLVELMTLVMFAGNIAMTGTTSCQQ